MPANREKLNPPPFPLGEEFSQGISIEQKKRAFIHKLLNEDTPGSDAEGPLRSPDGSYLKTNELRNFFVDTLVTEARYTKPVARHLLKFYVEPLLDERISVIKEMGESKDKERKNELTQESKKLADSLVLLLRDIAINPRGYGIDIEKQNKPRHELVIDYNVLAAQLDDSDILDPLYVNGQLPMPKPLGDSFKRIFETLYPERRDNAVIRQTVLLLKERCVNQLVRELLIAERLPLSTREERKQRTESVSAVVERMTQFMRHALESTGKKIEMYVRGIETGRLPEDAVQFPTITQRPSYNEIEMATTDGERAKNTQTFYQNLSKTYSSEKVVRLISDFDTQSTNFFRDEAGVKDVPHVYYDALFVLQQKGMEQEEIEKTFLPFVTELITAMVQINDSINAEHQKGFDRDQKQIDILKNKLGNTRREYLREAKKQIDEGDFLRSIVMDPVSSEVVLSVMSGKLKENNDEGIYFSCSDFDDIDARLEALYTFENVLSNALTPLESKRGANVLTMNNVFLTLRDAYSAKLGLFKKKLAVQHTTKAEAISLSQEIVDMHTSLVAFYNEAINTNDMEL